MDPESVISLQHDYSPSQLTALKQHLHKINQEHSSLKQDLEKLLDENSDLLSQYATRSLQLRAQVKQAKKLYQSAIPPEKLELLKEKRLLYQHLQTLKTPSAEALALHLFQQEVYRIIFSFNPQSITYSSRLIDWSSFVLEDIKIPLKQEFVISEVGYLLFDFCRAHQRITNRDYQLKLVQACNLYLVNFARLCNKTASTPELGILCSECELFHCFFTWNRFNRLEYDWIGMGRELFCQHVVDKFIAECDQIQEAFNSMALDHKTAEKFESQIQLLQAQISNLNVVNWNFLNDADLSNSILDVFLAKVI